MIKEEYVSFEVARLLKDKGFNEPTIGTYNIESKNPILVERPIRAIHCEAIISAPTLQMAMMWLREVHNIHIVIHPYTEMEGHNWSFIFDKFAYGCWQELGIYITDSWNTYEEACEAAIKYCLENLI